MQLLKCIFVAWSKICDHGGRSSTSLVKRQLVDDVSDVGPGSTLMASVTKQYSREVLVNGQHTT